MASAAFIFIAAGADPSRDRSLVETPGVKLHVIGVSSYEQGAQVASEMADAGCPVIELCGGFGIRGTYIVQQAVEGRAKVGVVRFDAHPAAGYRSGDERY